MGRCARAVALWAAVLVAAGAGARVAAYTVDCNHDYTDCETELRKLTEDDELSSKKFLSATLPNLVTTTTASPTRSTPTVPQISPERGTLTDEIKEQLSEPVELPEFNAKPKPRLLSLNDVGLQFAKVSQNYTNEEKGRKKGLSDLSDVNLDEDEEVLKTVVAPPMHNKNMPDKFYSNLQAPFHTLLTMDGSEEADTCRENNLIYKIGEKLERGCEEICECSIGGVFECSARCKHPYMRRGRQLIDPLCIESPVDECCSIMACAGNGETKPTTMDICRFGNDTYPMGAKWNVGCEKVCTCEKNSIVECRPRCDPLPPSDKCINVLDPSDACCEVQVCDVSQDAHEEPMDNSTSTTTTTTTETVPKWSPNEIEEADNMFKKSTIRPLVLAEPIGSVKVLQNNSVQVNLMHMNSSDDPIHLLLSDDGGKTFKDVILRYSNLILNLDGGKDYILKTKETGTKFNFTITASGDNVPLDKPYPETKPGCYENGTFYSVGEEFHIGCEELCECKGPDTRECATLQCPSHVGLEIVSKGCVRWAPSPPAEPPNCCPRSARCLSDGTCHYKDIAIPNWSEVPITLTGCELRCFCENGELDCQEVCTPLTELPPQTLRCPPMHRPAPVNVSDEDCCKQWGCVPNAEISNGPSLPNYSMPNINIMPMNHVTHAAPFFETVKSLVVPIPPTTTDSTDFYKHFNPVKTSLFKNIPLPGYDNLKYNKATFYKTPHNNISELPYFSQEDSSVIESSDHNIDHSIEKADISEIKRDKVPKTDKNQNQDNIKSFKPVSIEESIWNNNWNLPKKSHTPQSMDFLEKQQSSPKINNNIEVHSKSHKNNIVKVIQPKQTESLKPSELLEMKNLNFPYAKPIKPMLINSSFSTDQKNREFQTEKVHMSVSHDLSKKTQSSGKLNAVTQERYMLFNNKKYELPKHNQKNIASAMRINSYFSPSYYTAKHSDPDVSMNFQEVDVNLNQLPNIYFKPQMKNLSSNYMPFRMTTLPAPYIRKKPVPRPQTLHHKNQHHITHGNSFKKYVTVMKKKDNKAKSLSINNNDHVWGSDTKKHVLTKARNPYDSVLLRAQPNQKTDLKSVFTRNHGTISPTKKYSTLDLEQLLSQMEVDSEINRNRERSAGKSADVIVAGHATPPPNDSDPHKPFLPTVLPDINFPHTQDEFSDFDHNNIHRPPHSLGPEFPHPLLPGHEEMNKKLFIISLQADSPTSIKMLFGLPPVLVGLQGSVDLRYTDKADEDLSQWSSQVFAPADEVLTTARLEFRLTGLKPSTTYKVRAKLYIHNLPFEPESDVFSVRTQDLPTISSEEEKRRELDSRLTVLDVNDTTAAVSWRHFSEDELQYIDGIQVRFRPVGTPIYIMTELLHHSRTTAQLQDLRPGSKYEASLVLIPPPRVTTELYDPGRVEFTTAPYVDPYNWSVTVEARTVGSEAAELTWRGVPAPAERWVRVYRAVHACQDNQRRENDAFRLAARDLPSVVTLTGLQPDTRCRVWLELFLTNGKVKTSNVLEITTKSLDSPEPIDNKIQAASMPGGRSSPRGDYYSALVVVGVIAALGVLASVLLALVVVRRHRPHSVAITSVPSAPRESSLPPYDNPAYTIDLPQESIEL